MPTLFIARKDHDLAWLRSMPQGWRVIIHDLSGTLDPGLFANNVEIIQGALEGGLPEAYLRFMAHEAIGEADDVTVLSPQDPLAHSPDFFALLRAHPQWRNIQTLSSIASSQHNLPPMSVLLQDRRDHLQSLSVRAERYSLATLQVVSHHDDAHDQRTRVWAERQGLRDGSNLAAYFLETCGVLDIAQMAFEGDIGLCAPGSLFAVRNPVLQAVQIRLQTSLPGLLKEARRSGGDDLLFQRLWLHLMGEPFIRFENDEAPTSLIDPVQVSMASVVASIDAVLARSGVSGPSPLGNPDRSEVGGAVQSLFAGLEPVAVPLGKTGTH